MQKSKELQAVRPSPIISQRIASYEKTQQIFFSYLREISTPGVEVSRRSEPGAGVTTDSDINIEFFKPSNPEIICQKHAFMLQQMFFKMELRLLHLAQHIACQKLNTTQKEVFAYLFAEILWIKICKIQFGIPAADDFTNSFIAQVFPLVKRIIMSEYPALYKKLFPFEKIGEILQKKMPELLCSIIKGSGCFFDIQDFSIFLENKANIMTQFITQALANPQPSLQLLKIKISSTFFRWTIVMLIPHAREILLIYPEENEAFKQEDILITPTDTVQKIKRPDTENLLQLAKQHHLNVRISFAINQLNFFNEILLLIVDAVTTNKKYERKTYSEEDFSALCYRRLSLFIPIALEFHKWAKDSYDFFEAPQKIQESIQDHNLSFLVTIKKFLQIFLLYLKYQSTISQIKTIIEQHLENDKPSIKTLTNIWHSIDRRIALQIEIWQQSQLQIHLPSFAEKEKDAAFFLELTNAIESLEEEKIKQHLRNQFEQLAEDAFWQYDQSYVLSEQPFKLIKEEIWIQLIEDLNSLPQFAVSTISSLPDDDRLALFIKNNALQQVTIEISRQFIDEGINKLSHITQTLYEYANLIAKNTVNSTTCLPNILELFEQQRKLIFFYSSEFSGQQQALHKTTNHLKEELKNIEIEIELLQNELPILESEKEWLLENPKTTEIQSDLSNEEISLTPIEEVSLAAKELKQSYLPIETFQHTTRYQAVSARITQCLKRIHALTFLQKFIQEILQTNKVYLIKLVNVCRLFSRFKSISELRSKVNLIKALLADEQEIKEKDLVVNLIQHAASISFIDKSLLQQKNEAAAAPATPIAETLVKFSSILPTPQKIEVQRNFPALNFP